VLELEHACKLCLGPELRTLVAVAQGSTTNRCA
jgi:hypothetical protein